MYTCLHHFSQTLPAIYIYTRISACSYFTPAFFVWLSLRGEVKRNRRHIPRYLLTSRAVHLFLECLLQPQRAIDLKDLRFAASLSQAFSSGIHARDESIHRPRHIYFAPFPEYSWASYALTQRQDLQASTGLSIIKRTQGPSTVRCLSHHESRPGVMPPSAVCCLYHKLFPLAVTPGTSRLTGLGISLPIFSNHVHVTPSLNGRICKPRFTSLLPHVPEGNHVTSSLNCHVSHASAFRCLSITRANLPAIYLRAFHPRGPSLHRLRICFLGFLFSLTRLLSAATRLFVASHRVLFSETLPGHGRNLYSGYATHDPTQSRCHSSDHCSLNVISSGFRAHFQCTTVSGWSHALH